MSSTQWT